MSSCLKPLAAVLLIATQACDNSLTQPDVHSVQVTGAPTTPLLNGATVQLFATPLNETGAVISNCKVSWKSQDETIATVSANGLVTAVGAGFVDIAAACRNVDGSARLDVRAGGPIGPDGGNISLLQGAVTINLPAGAILQSTTLLVRPAPAPPQSARLVSGTAYEIAPESMLITRPVTLSLRYSAANVPAGIADNTLQLYTRVGDGWNVVRGSTVDVTTRVVTGQILRAGVYAVLSTAVERIALTGASAGGALVVGQTGQLTAHTLAVNNDTLKGRTITWATSDATKATVVNGLVTAVGAGTATITATSEGKTASTTITILSRAQSDWSQVTDEWTMFQGNAAHTGYVPAMLDPIVFRELWTANVSTGVRLTPVTEGAGNVYVATGSSFGTQQLRALDLQTGAHRWTAGFGNVHGVHPPAYSQGGVYVTTSGHEDSFLHRYDAATGALSWRSPYNNQWSTYYAPTIVDGRVHTAGGTYGGTYAHNAANGARLWFAQTLQYDQWTPAVRGTVAYSFTGASGIYAHNVATGAMLFTIPFPNFDWRGWSMDLAPVLGSSNNIIAATNGRLVSFDLTSRTVGWVLTGTYDGQVSVGNGVIYVQTADRVEARSESTGALLWSWTPPSGNPIGTMIVTRNLLFVGTDSSTYGVDLNTHLTVWSHPSSGHLALSKQGILLIAQSNGTVRAIAVK